MKKRLIKKFSIASALSRREILNFLSGTAIVSICGCTSRKTTSITANSSIPANSSAQVPALAAPACVVKPEQTEGPYFVDEKLNRSDLRSDPSDGSVKAGVPLQLIFQVSRIDSAAQNPTCTPLSGATVDVWHCDAEGIYSDVNDRSFSTVGKKFLRGYQVINENGTAEFITIYPGWYPGRTVHIHFKIRTDAASGQGYEFTSQLYFDDRLTDQVHAQAPYAVRGQRNRRNDQDGIFQNGGEQLMLQLSEAAEGYVGRFVIGLEWS